MVNDIDKYCRDGAHDYKCCACVEQSFHAPESINNPLRIQYFLSLIHILQNPGIDVFVKRDIPFLKQYDTKIIVNVCGKSEEDYCEVVERLAEEPVDLLEINVSCPNVKEGGIAFGQDPKALQHITEQVKKRAKQPVIMKLSPNVTDITVMAKAAEAGGADALSMINTLTGMKIDINRCV